MTLTPTLQDLQHAERTYHACRLAAIEAERNYSMAIDNYQAGRITREQLDLTYSVSRVLDEQKKVLYKTYNTVKALYADAQLDDSRECHCNHRQHCPQTGYIKEIEF